MSCQLFRWPLPLPFYFSYYDVSRQDILCWRYPTIHHQIHNHPTCLRLPLLLHAELQSEISGFQLYSSTYQSEKYHRYLRLHHFQLYSWVSCVRRHAPPSESARTSCIIMSCNNYLQSHQWRSPHLMTYWLQYQHLRYPNRRSYIVLAWYNPYIESHLHHSPVDKVQTPRL